MPKRNSVLKCSTPIQGDDAYVVIRQPTYGEMRAMVRENADSITNGVQVNKVEQNMELMINVVKKYVIQWNWVYEDGTPMPFPASKPEVVEELTSAEIKQICDLIYDEDAIKKNVIT